MTTQPNKEGKQLRANFERIIDLLCDLAVQFESDPRFDDGMVVSETDKAMMRISYDDLASKAFWEPYPKDAKIKAALDDFEEMVDDIEHETERRPTQTVQDAYLFSMDYSDFLYYCVTNATFHNAVFGGEKIDILDIILRKRGVGEGGRANSVSPTGPCTFEGVQ